MRSYQAVIEDQNIFLLTAAVTAGSYVTAGVLNQPDEYVFAR